MDASHRPGRTSTWPRRSLSDSQEREVQQREDNDDRYHNRLAQLWDRPVGFDIMIICGPGEGSRSWYLHRDIITGESRVLARELPPRSGVTPQYYFLDPGRDPNFIGQRNAFFHYAYHKTYHNARIDPAYPWDATCLSENTAMYICGAAMESDSLMAYAAAKINEATEVIGRVIHMDRDRLGADYDFLKLERPLRRALMMLYDQPHQRSTDGLDPALPPARRTVFFDLRLALARFVDETMMYCHINKAFGVALRNQWGPIYMDMCRDNIFFAEHGLLRGLDRPLLEHLQQINLEYNQSATAEREDSVAVAAADGSGGDGSERRAASSEGKADFSAGSASTAIFDPREREEENEPVKSRGSSAQTVVLLRQTEEAEAHGEPDSAADASSKTDIPAHDGRHTGETEQAALRASSNGLEVSTAVQEEAPRAA